MEKDNDKGSNSRISFDISTSRWKWRPIHQSSSSTSPSPRHLHSLVSHNNYLYLFGGFGDGEKYLDDLWQFSLVKRRWKKIKSKNHPSARHSHQTVVYRSKMILFGGISEGKTMNDLWSFDFATESWKQEQVLYAVWGHSMVVFADKLIIFGGADENVKVTNKTIVLAASTLEPIAVTIKNVPSARQYASMLAYDGAIYLFGGFNNKSLQDFYKITISADENNQIVTESLEVPSFVQNLRAASLSLLPFQSQLILFGGRTNKQLSDVTYSFAIGSSKWSTCATVGPSARYYHQVRAMNGRVILFGGLGIKEGSDKAVNLNDMWVYTDEVVDVHPENIKLDPSYIPTEIWNTILTHLADSAKSVVSASMVSKQFYNIVLNDELLMRKRRKFISNQTLVMPEIKNNVIKIVVEGVGGTGRTSTVKRFCHNYLPEDYEPVIEDDNRKKYVVDGTTYLLDILDMAGPAEYSAMLHRLYRFAHGLYMVFSITNRESFIELDHYMTVALQAKESENFPVIIAGNKCDLESQRQVSREEAQQYAEKRGAQYIETSAKTRHNIEEAFTTLVRIIVEANEGRNGNPNKNKSNTKKDRCLTM